MVTLVLIEQASHGTLQQLTGVSSASTVQPIAFTPKTTFYSPDCLGSFGPRVVNTPRTLLEKRKRCTTVDEILENSMIATNLRPNEVVLGGLLNCAAERLDWRRADILWRLGLKKCFLYEVGQTVLGDIWCGECSPFWSTWYSLYVFLFFMN